MKPTLKDVAKLAGVNFTLVSKYLNHSSQARMTPETRARIDSALKELNYRPSASARTLRSGKSRTIGLVCGDLTNAYSAHFANLILNFLREHGYQLLIAVRGSEADCTALDFLTDRDVDGLILSGADLPENYFPKLPTAVYDTSVNRGSVMNPDLGRSLDAALAAVNGRIAGLFFRNSAWNGAFQLAAHRRGLDAEARILPFDLETRATELRKVCQEKPEWILTSGWQTLLMLQDLLGDEFPGYHPHLLVHANCRGPFMNAPEIAGVIHSNTSDMVRELCTMLLGQIENSGSVPESRLFPTVFRPAGSPEFEALKTRHFQLT